MKTELSIEKIKKITSEYGMKYGAERIYLFGSYAKGTATETSDIDLRIDRGNVRGLAMGSLLVDLEDSFGKKVDLISTKCFDKDFLDSIKTEEILLYERS